jgi:hypothetical protein
MLVASFLALLLCTSIDGGQEKFTQESCEGEQNELQLASAAAAKLRVLVPWFFFCWKNAGFSCLEHWFIQNGIYTGCGTVSGAAD